MTEGLPEYLLRRRYARGPVQPVYDWFPAAGRWGGFSFSRPSAAGLLDLDSDGDLDAVAAEQPRLFEAGPLAGFLAVEGAKTEYYPNNTFAGLSVGGDLPGRSGVSSLITQNSIESFATLPDGRLMAYVRLRTNGSNGATTWPTLTGTNQAVPTVLAADPYTAAALVHVADAGGAAEVFIRLGWSGGGVATAGSNTMYALGTGGLQALVKSMEVPEGAANVGLSLHATVPANTAIAPLIGIAFPQLQRGADGAPIATSGTAVTTAAEVISRPVTVDEVAQGSLVLDWWHPGAFPARSARSLGWMYSDGGNNRLAVRLHTGGSGGVQDVGIISTGIGFNSDAINFTQAAGRNRLAMAWSPALGFLSAHNGVALPALAYTAPGGSLSERIGHEATVTGGQNVRARLIRRVMRYADPLPMDQLLAFSRV